MSEAHAVNEAETVYGARLNECTQADWAAIRKALQTVESAGSHGHWTESVQLSDGSWQMPWAALSGECRQFLRTLERVGLHIPFDWVAWDHGRELAQHPDRLDNASPAEAAMLIFAIWRSDRFVEGALLDGFDSGLIQQAARRMLDAAR